MGSRSPTLTEAFTTWRPAMRDCTVCADPRRDQIDAMLLGGSGRRTIARAFPGASADAIGRHARNHLAQDTPTGEVTRVTDVAAPEPGAAQAEPELMSIARAIMVGDTLVTP